MTIYGISTLQPGDIFRTNYLPKEYLDNTYFQVIKVRHTIDSTGWTTELETLMRMRPDKKDIGKLILPWNSIMITPSNLGTNINPIAPGGQSGGASGVTGITTGVTGVTGATTSQTPSAPAGPTGPTGLVTGAAPIDPLYGPGGACEGMTFKECQEHLANQGMPPI